MGRVKHGESYEFQRFPRSMYLAKLRSEPSWPPRPNLSTDSNGAPFLATIRGDLANITSTPFFLAPQSIVEVSTCWSERPSLFVAPALEPDAQKRALLVLKWVICSLRTQFYVGSDINTGIRKPLNAFLGELFLAQWTDDTATSKTITEQVRLVCWRNI